MVPRGGVWQYRYIKSLDKSGTHGLPHTLLRFSFPVSHWPGRKFALVDEFGDMRRWSESE